MKKIFFSLAIATLILGCKPTAVVTSKVVNSEIIATINLNDIKDDKVAVVINVPTITTENTIYHMPKSIPGTYSEDNYGKQIDDFKAFDAKGNSLTFVKLDDNSWSIQNAKSLNKITYLVNDTFDTESGSSFGGGIFSPAGTNINQGKNFMLNNHGFVGYFDDKKELTYNVTILHPEILVGATSMIDLDESITSDNFIMPRYNDFIDNPIMYAKPDFTKFNVDGMEILFAVYSPNGKHSAKALSTDLEKMMRAQKTFLGAVNSNKKYTVLLYLSTMKQDAKGFGALEHNSSTTVVFPEMMPSSMLGKQLIDVVSHEFFHIVTPLGVHSNEIHNFDFNMPKMSQHLWMYEGVTEYFANLFQVNQGLISENDFYERMDDKINNAKKMDDKMPFTLMSENVLVEPYKGQYLNVYEKGALIGMCIDIIIREKSDGQKGILNLMQKLTNEYGPKKPFNDSELFSKITELTYPEVGDFLATYVSGSTPIPYEVYFAKMGIVNGKVKKAQNPFLNGKTSSITAKLSTKEIIVKKDTELTQFLQKMGVKSDDIIMAINGTNYNLDTISEMMETAQKWKEGDVITMKVKREGKEQLLSGKAVLVFEESEGYQSINASKDALRQSWLKG